jgi:hypothetical protein
MVDHMAFIPVVLELYGTYGTNAAGEKALWY